MTNTAQQIDQFLQFVFEPTDIIEMRIILTDGNVVSGRFDDFVSMAHQATTWSNDPTTKAIYYTLNPIDPAKAKFIGHWQANVLRSKARSTRDHDVLRRNLYLIDIDAERQSATSATDEEKDHALRLANKVRAYLNDSGFSEPVMIDSGNGYALLYKGDAAYAQGDLWTDALRYLATMFNSPGAKVDTSVGNAARVSRLPFTPNRKGEDTAERPHRVAKVVSYPAIFEPVPMRAIAKLAAQHVATRSNNNPKRNSALLIDEDGVQQLIAEFDELLQLGRVTDAGDATYFELLECPFAGRAHSGSNVGYGKTTIRLTPDSIGFCCFSDECADHTFGALLKFLHEKTGRWPSMPIWDRLTLADCIQRWGGVSNEGTGLDHDLALDQYIAAYDKRMEAERETDPLFAFDSASFFTVAAPEFKTSAAPAYPVEPWGLTADEVIAAYKFACREAYQRMRHRGATAEQIEAYLAPVCRIVGRNDIRAMAEELGSEEMFLMARDKERRNQFPAEYGDTTDSTGRIVLSVELKARWR